MAPLWVEEPCSPSNDSLHFTYIRRVLDLADCRGLGAESLRRILCGPANLARLEGLVLDGIAEVM